MIREQRERLFVTFSLGKDEPTWRVMGRFG